MTRRPGRRAVLLLGAVALAAGCGLPLPGGVQRPGEVPAEQRLPQPINVLPPGPQRDTSPEAAVLGFLAAQSSPSEGHGIARSFLAPAARSGWHDDAGVTVYDPRTVAAARPVPDGDGVAVVVDLDVLGDIGADGAAHVQNAQRREQRYRLRQDDERQWQLVGVPAGLSLSPAGRERSFEPLSVHFLAPPGPPPSPRHLVADLVQLPADGDRAQEVVARLLAGPSSALAGSASTAVPAGTALHAPVTTSAAGEVTVDLTGPAGRLSETARADLSAQLVWTLRDALPDFTRLRLLVDGGVLPVPGVAQPQPRGAWSQYAPDGTAERPGGVAVLGGTLRALQSDDEARQALPPVGVTGAVDVAVDARHERIAVLTDEGSTRTLRVGPFVGPLVAGPAEAGLRSPTWGSGDLGLFVLRTGSSPAVLLLPAAPLPPETPGSVTTGTPAAAPVVTGTPVQVQVDGLPALDSSSLLRVSRDGTRLALVAGGVLQVGRLELGGRAPHVVALHRLATGVLDVAWQTGTTLEVLVQDTEPPLLPLLRLSIDGTSAQSSGLAGVLEAEPVSVAAYGDQPLLVETSTNGRSTVYSGDGAAGFQVELRDGSRPSYPR